MKILFSLLAFCLFASCVHSQEAVDTVSVRVQYRALYKHTQEQKEAYDDINLLDIGRLRLGSIANGLSSFCISVIL